MSRNQQALVQLTARVAAAGLLWGAGTAFAQRGTGDWMTSGFDAQRSNWVRSDAKISPESMSKPGFELSWKMKLNSSPRQLNSLTAPVLLDFYIGYRGFRALGFMSTASGNVIGVDTELARMEWEKPSAVPQTAGVSVSCPGGLTAAVTRPLSIAYPSGLAGRGPGRGTPAKSGVGEPFQGAVTIKPAPAPSPVPATPPPGPPGGPAGAGARRAAPAVNLFAPRVQWVNSITADGKFHGHYVSNGEEPTPAVQFLPANANVVGLAVFDGHAYAATKNCGNVPSGVWVLDLETQQTKSWKAEGDVAGTAGPAIGPDGSLYVAAGKQIVALEEKTLQSKAAFQNEQGYSSSPVIFDFKGKDLLAVATTDGRLQLFDTASVGSGPIAKSEVFSGAGFETGALASWQDAAGVRWILVPASAPAGKASGFVGNGEIKNGAIFAWKVEESNGKFSLRPGWSSPDMISPLPPIIVNGVVFAASSGEFRGGGSAAERAKKSVPAVLYALDSLSGRELWSSGNTITSFAHSGGLSAGGSRVFIGTYDGMQYAFGFPIEH